MQGAWWPNDIEFGFDFSSVAHLVDDIENPNYFLIVERYARGNKEASVAKLTGFSVYDYRESMTNPKVFKYDGGGNLEKGLNYYSVYTVPPVKTSYSPVEWISSQTLQPVSAPLVVRTANGRYAKIRFSEYDRSAGTIRIKYVYNPEGGRDLK